MNLRTARGARSSSGDGPDGAADGDPAFEARDVHGVEAARDLAGLDGGGRRHRLTAGGPASGQSLQGPFHVGAGNGPAHPEHDPVGRSAPGGQRPHRGQRDRCPRVRRRERIAVEEPLQFDLGSVAVADDPRHRHVVAGACPVPPDRVGVQVGIPDDCREQFQPRAPVLRQHVQGEVGGVERLDHAQRRSQFGEAQRKGLSRPRRPARRQKMGQERRCPGLALGFVEPAERQRRGDTHQGVRCPGHDVGADAARRLEEGLGGIGGDEGRRAAENVARGRPVVLEDGAGAAGEGVVGIAGSQGEGGGGQDREDEQRCAVRWPAASACRSETGVPSRQHREREWRGVVADLRSACRSETGVPGRRAAHCSCPRSLDHAKSSQLGPLPSGGSARAVAITRLEGTK